jgi:hypothetical protein
MDKPAPRTAEQKAQSVAEFGGILLGIACTALAAVIIGAVVLGFTGIVIAHWPAILIGLVLLIGLALLL